MDEGDLLIVHASHQALDDGGDRLHSALGMTGWLRKG